ncbi:hypothetical protein [Hoeflea sp.]|uniref:hypothetical protein n=1 Tax=Hoeflea sp. TaxID=1940281 RepID=UPI0025BEA866|nr:hypothetical protein [Hoeflea sp.]MBU4528015.1 hypothetical protein [Alphaproteobacteria bacterium]MBU4542289.1 hypothetical protein [Alphaproteobacteria bacterium]MBU4549007.1 hypothetical protein [Alphaproteobacteria bacterium]MBV1783551.1 hypothetical protein [Hoeflea sp.]
MVMPSIRDKICMVGIGTTDYGNFPETDTYGLGSQALMAALDDAGLQITLQTVFSCTTL